MFNLTKFAERLDGLISEKQITQERLAENTDIKAPSICRYLQGNCMPTVSSLIKLADYFGCSTDYLLGLKDEYEPQMFAPCPPFSTRIEYFLKQTKLKDHHFCTELKLPESCFYEWKNGKREPTLENVYKFAKYFDCSIDFILGREV